MPSPATTPPKNQPRRERSKQDRVVEGCRRLAQRQGQGECFSRRAIARECGVDKSVIKLVEDRALGILARRIRQTCPEVIQQIFVDRPFVEIFADVSTRFAPKKKKRRKPAAARPLASDEKDSPDFDFDAA